MKKYIAEGIVIFASIFASFSVENIRQNSIEKEVLNDAVITLGDEIESNIEYTKEHLKQVKNMHYVMERVFNDFQNISLNDIYTLHDNNPYIYKIIENGEIEIYTIKPAKKDIKRSRCPCDCWGGGYF